MSGQDTNETLLAFRQEIDALDDKIIALLRERIDIIARVGQWKGTYHPGECPIRAGREAEMIRRVMQKFEDSKFSPVAAAAMWRILIGASVCVESPLSLSIYAPAQDELFYWLAREYFGPTLPVTRQPHINRVFGDLKDGKASIGIVPTLRSDTANWWLGLIPCDAPKIFARIPFIAAGPPVKYPAALAIARIMPEASGNDVSLMVLEADHNVSQNRLQTAFSKAKLIARWISITSPDAIRRLHLIELKGFITATNIEMKKFLSDVGETVMQTHYLGSYALPIVVKSTETITSYAPSTAKA